MKIHTTNYFNTFIEVAEDCPVSSAEIPPTKGDKKSIAYYQFEMIIDNPYQFSSDDVLFKVFAIRNKLMEGELGVEREHFFSKGKPCFRTSSLPKRYGWGVHNNEDGKIALYALESVEYKKILLDETVEKVRALRTKR